jgi:3-hydroxybutyrate dehydrogenase
MTARELEGRVALVTGGASGQGRAIALALAAAGADVAIGSYLSDHRAKAVNEDVTFPTKQALEDTAEAIRALGVQALARDHDLRSPQSCRDLVDGTEAALGKIDILVNAAGTSLEQPILGHTEEQWALVLDTNLNGAFRMIAACLPAMMARGWGRIVNIASTAANVGAASNPAYCASKAGLLGLTRSVALEGAAHGVTCNAINPGYVRTGMMMSNVAQQARARNISAEDVLAEIVESYPQKRVIEPEEIAALACFLCSDAARGITGEDVTVAAGSLW